MGSRGSAPVVPPVSQDTRLQLLATLDELVDLLRGDGVQHALAELRSALAELTPREQAVAEREVAVAAREARLNALLRDFDNDHAG